MGFRNLTRAKAIGRAMVVFWLIVVAILGTFVHPVIVTWGLLALLIFAARLINRHDPDPMLVPAQLEIDGDRVRVVGKEDTYDFRTSDIAAGWEISDRRVVLQFRSTNELLLELPIAPPTLLARMGIDFDQRANEAPLRGLLGPFTRGVLAAMAVLVVASIVSTGFRTPPSFFAGAALAVATGVFVARRFGHGRVLVGADGVRIMGALRTRFIPYAEIKSLTKVRHARDGYIRLHLHLANGTKEILPLVGQLPRQVDALAHRIQIGIYNHASGTPRRLDALARGSRDVSAWREDLRRLALGEAGFRTAAISREDLEATLRDGSAPTELRIGAALVLREIDPEGAPVRIRVAADASADEHAKQALAAAADDALDETLIDRARAS